MHRTELMVFKGLLKEAQAMACNTLCPSDLLVAVGGWDPKGPTKIAEVTLMRPIHGNL